MQPAHNAVQYIVEFVAMDWTHSSVYAVIYFVPLSVQFRCKPICQHNKLTALSSSVSAFVCTMRDYFYASRNDNCRRGGRRSSFALKMCDIHVWQSRSAMEVPAHSCPDLPGICISSGTVCSRDLCFDSD